MVVAYDYQNKKQQEPEPSLCILTPAGFVAIIAFKPRVGPLLRTTYFREEALCENPTSRWRQFARYIVRCRFCARPRPTPIPLPTLDQEFPIVDEAISGKCTRVRYLSPEMWGFVLRDGAWVWSGDFPKWPDADSPARRTEPYPLDRD
jgi:hypothetical protein